MKKLLLIIGLLSQVLNVSSQTTNRWKCIEPGTCWDTQSSVKIGGTKVRFFYEYPFMEEQRRYLVQRGLYNSREAQEVAYGRSGVVVNCATYEYGIFSANELNAQRNPMGPAASTPINKVQMNYIEPDTIMETLTKDVCRSHKFSK